ncbi:ubiquinone biosynthesis accessory factor UbiJ [Piscirickettsia salmonis]|uniref:ubiquinone biosynthesis accessory factor UbiJ n=1 Tax=Piscirickettsia salmonis TaxID=1238 RepID=UPI0007C8FA96|nr:SCP-2 sterol transfer family protein [Piscirickettsiaceae bacterium NZ-RLO1]
MAYAALLKPVLPVLTSALNKALKTDRWLMQSWSGLSGRVLALEIKELDVPIYVYLLADGLLLSLEQIESTSSASFVNHADVTIRGDIAGLLALVKAKDPQTVILSRQVVLHGDVATLQEVQRYLAMFEFDWEGEISRYVDPLWAGVAGQGLRMAKGWLGSASESFKKNTSEFVLYEQRLLVSHEEMNDWLERLQSLRLDVERLSMRLNLLEAKKGDD